MAQTEQITVLLQEFSDGNKDALNRLMPFVYAELRRLANSLLHSESKARTLQPTALVHEAYARLVGQENPPFASRSHFLAIAAKVMRQILTDYARRRKTSKRGAGLRKTTLGEALNAAVEEPAIMVALSDALDELEKKDPRKARLIEMRYFGGLTLAEAAEVTGLTVNVIRYDLRIAQAWLHRELNFTAAEL
jgi:RNA polymerase sigma factor (TIGR02999 family)